MVTTNESSRMSFMMCDDDESDCETEGQARPHQPDKLGRGHADGKFACCGGGQCEAERYKAGGVVHEAFAFNNRHDAPGKMDLLRDRGGGNCVGRRNERAEGERHRQRQLWQQGMHDESRGDGREQNQPDRELENGAQVGLEVVPGGKLLRQAAHSEEAEGKTKKTTSGLM